MLFACHLNKSEQKKSFDIERKIIFFTDNVENFKNLNTIGTKRKHLKFDEFDKTGFCICDELNYYLNNCKEIKKETNCDGYIIIGIFIAIFLIVFWMHGFLTKE